MPTESEIKKKKKILFDEVGQNDEWENAFDALIEDQVILPNYKLYYLGEYTSGAAQKTISGLLGLWTEDAYKRARKILKERFGDPFRI